GIASYAAAFEQASQVPEQEDPLGRARRLWTWIHLVSLRIPVAEAHELRAWCAQEANAAPGATDEKPADDEALAPDSDGSLGDGNLSPDDHLVPPLDIIGYDGSGEGAQPGDTTDETSDALARMALLARQVEWLADNDPAVRTGFLKI